jgi:hypothetical protein
VPSIGVQPTDGVRRRKEIIMSVPGAGEHIKAAVSAWEGITAHPHRFGGTEYRLERREIGHVHGDGLVDIPFPTKIRDEIVAAGNAKPHHILPDSGWISFYLREPPDVERAIALLRRSYEIATAQQAARRGRAERPA